MRCLGEACLYCLLGVILLVPVDAVAAPPYQIEVSKSQRILWLKQGAKIIKQYQIAVGSGGSGRKRYTGDKKSPVGSYHIVNITDSSRFHQFLQLNYPAPDDAWYGYRAQLIDGKQFKSIVSEWQQQQIPLQNTRLGGQIGIHGIGDITQKKLAIHKAVNWTEGCIALTNDDIDDLTKFIALGTEVLIYE